MTGGKKSARLLGAVAALCMALLVSAANAAPPFSEDCDHLHEQPETRAICVELNAAADQIARGDLRGAIERLEAIRHRPIEDLVNARPAMLLGIARCRNGEIPLGRLEIDLYECALRIDFRALSCWIDDNPAKGLSPRIPPACAALACGEAYVRGRPEAFSSRMRELQEARLICEAR